MISKRRPSSSSRCVRERDREGGRDREGERDRDRVYVCMCARMCACVRASTCVRAPKPYSSSLITITTYTQQKFHNSGKPNKEADAVLNHFLENVEAREKDAAKKSTAGAHQPDGCNAPEAGRCRKRALPN